jgi:hypothetical protein
MTCYCIEIFLPLRAPDGSAFPKTAFSRLEDELVARFGGVTAFTRAPARGQWRDGGQVERDEIVVFEVMADALDSGWWSDLRARLETEFRQKELVIRAHEIKRL